jgi:hypothetical protein
MLPVSWTASLAPLRAVLRLSNMRIGLDLDNTLACYDATFASLAVCEPDLPVALARTKLGLRDHLRRCGREPRWTELQGHAYGPGMRLARPFPGALEFIGNARASGHCVMIISQRSPRPFAGEPYDLHSSARAWIDEHLRDAAGPLFNTDSVVFEADRDAKVARIGACACDVFVDDLPEVLEHPRFPSTTLGFLFVPQQQGAAHSHAASADDANGTRAAVRSLSRWEGFAPWSGR